AAAARRDAADGVVAAHALRVHARRRRRAEGPAQAAGEGARTPRRRGARLRQGALAVIGVPLYNAGEDLEPALTALLAQSEPRFGLVLVDDGSADGTADLAARLTVGDRRVTLVRNERRLGLVGNWRRCFEVGRERHPGARYFAWGSDHDVWSP